MINVVQEQPYWVTSCKLLPINTDSCLPFIPPYDSSLLFSFLPYSSPDRSPCPSSGPFETSARADGRSGIDRCGESVILETAPRADSAPLPLYPFLPSMYMHCIPLFSTPASQLYIPLWPALPHDASHHVDSVRISMCRYIGDAKYGRHVGTDQFGNRFFENTNPMEEVPGE